MQMESFLLQEAEGPLLCVGKQCLEGQAPEETTLLSPCAQSICLKYRENKLSARGSTIGSRSLRFHSNKPLWGGCAGVTCF